MNRDDCFFGVSALCLGTGTLTDSHGNCVHFNMEIKGGGKLPAEAASISYRPYISRPCLMEALM